MKKLAFLVISLLVFLSCNKNHFFDIEDVTIVVGDSVNVKIKRLDVKIETSGTYNFDVNSDGVNDFALSCSYYYFSDPSKGGSSWTWSLKVLSDNSKVLCDTIYSSKESFFFAPEPLSIKDTFSAAQGLWLISSDQLGNSGPYGSSAYFYSFGEFLLYYYAEFYYYYTPSPGECKGGIPWEEFITIKEKFIGIQSEKNGIVTIGWMKLYFDYAAVLWGPSVTLKEIGTADFPINRE